MAFNVSNDPFLTHALPAARAQGQPTPPAVAAPYQDAFALHGAPARAQREDPFRTHSIQPGPGAQPDAPRNLVNVGANPFLVGVPTTNAVWPPEAESMSSGRLPGSPQELRDLALDHWTAGIYRIMGPGDPERDSRSRQLLTLWPWLLFLWVLALWLFLEHFSNLACVALTCALGCASMLMVLAWFLGYSGRPVPLLPLGVLCLLAVGMGTWAGLFGWSHYFRQLWWLHTGPQLDNTFASTTAASSGDAAILNFVDPRTNRSTLDGAAVDDLRSAGFREGRIYCVAPILSPPQAGDELIPVNFWAVGIDCCESLGSFHCDASRDTRGGYGVVMLDHGFPCAGCNSDKFLAAVRKAEAMHGLVSAPGALHVRWVVDPAAIQSEAFRTGALFVVIAMAAALVALALPAHVVWYYGVGRSEDGTARIKM